MRSLPFKRVLGQRAIALIVAQKGRRVQADNAKIADNCAQTGEAAYSANSSARVSKTAFCSLVLI